MRIEAKQDEDTEDENFLRRLVLPEEDRRRYGIPWSGGYRWFRSPNVIPLERQRARRREWITTTAGGNGSQYT
jgi:hypothetical protein